MKAVVNPPATGLTYTPPTLLPQGDGSFVIRPGKPVQDLTPKQAAAYLGIAWSSIYKLLDAGKIPCRRPLRGKILISVEDCERWKSRTRDPEFWDRA